MTELTNFEQIVYNDHNIYFDGCWRS